MMTSRLNGYRIRRPTPALLASILGIALFCVANTSPDDVKAVSELQDGQRERRNVTVTRVIDGDTIEVDGTERVRLLGIDAPELAHAGENAEFYAAESTQWLRDALVGATVTLESRAGDRDRYGRTLAWVWDENGELVNRMLLRGGYARILDRFGLPAEFEHSLRKAAAEARVAGRGLWQKRTRRR